MIGMSQPYQRRRCHGLLQNVLRAQNILHPPKNAPMPL
jgi:hypothetical protein